jgi:2-polyprenyl-3-methyl-5-hydroxy-6-metoxy-1,4-benzoquinol methylase
MYIAHRHSGVFSPNAVMEEPAFLSAVGEIVGLNIADLGCGDGATADLLMRLGAASYLGVDGSAGMIELARQQVSAVGVEFACQRIEDLQLPAESFDLVTSRMVSIAPPNLGGPG